MPVCTRSSPSYCIVIGLVGNGCYKYTLIPSYPYKIIGHCWGLQPEYFHYQECN